MQDHTDTQLLDRARSGDHAALEELLERHQARVYRFGMKMCRDPEDAQDILQDTLLAMARGVRDFRGSSSLSTWLYTVARSFCIKKRRRSKFAPEVEASLDAGDGETGRIVDPAKAPDEEFVGRRIEEALEQAISALEPMYREVLVLRDVEGLTAAEVAEVLAISPAAVKSRLHRARLAVRAHLAPLLEIPSPVPAASGACPDIVSVFARHLEDEISAEVCAEMERHIEGCPRCRGACDTLKRTLALCRTSGTAAEIPTSVRESVKVALRSFLSDSV
jgi:RNA polymerase sigma-70 factor (ECF subfamily)